MSINAKRPRRRDTVEVFKTRLAEVIRASGLTRSAFARRVGTDRSTLTQLLAADNVRLPRAETLAAVSAEFQVSVDWLLGLSQEGQVGVDLLDDTLSIETGAGSPVDARLHRWQAEAVGYKIRYVPSTLPDLLKTSAVFHYEYDEHAQVPAEAHQERAEARLEYHRRPETDMEVCSSVQSVQSFARGEGMWHGLDVAARREQLQTMIALVDELYPTFRWFLFDGRRRFSAPLTVFGPLRAAIYMGDRYVVLSATAHVRALTEHFDDLIRAAVVQPADAIGFLREQLDGIAPARRGGPRAGIAAR